jgi:hypothetical protein
MAGKIFINYRQGDDPGFTQALYQRLEDGMWKATSSPATTLSRYSMLKSRPPTFCLL